MQLLKMIVLPTRAVINTFYQETVSIESANYEMEYLISKFVEVVDESRQCRGSNPASREVEEQFIQAVYYDGLADYVEGEQDMVFNAALSKLFRSLISILIEHDDQFTPDEGLMYMRLVRGDVIVGTFSLNPLTPEEFKAHRQKNLSGAVPWSELLS